MKRKNFKTIILGGGMAGLGCGRTLLEHGDKNFLIITKDIGGRVCTSLDRQVNYGAFYLRKDYRHVLSFARKTKKLFLGDFFFSRSYPHRLLDVRNTKNIPSVIRLIVFLRRFYKQYVHFKKQCETMSQKEVIENSPFIKRLFEISALTLVGELRIDTLAYSYIEPVVRATTFLRLADIPACAMLASLLPMIIPTYEFEIDTDRLVRPLDKRISIDEALAVQKKASRWIVKTRKCEYSAEHIVFALPIHSTKKLCSLKEKLNKRVSVYMIHVRAALKKKWQPSLMVIPVSGDDIVLVRERDDTYALYSTDENTALSKYFIQYEVIARKHWDPAFFIGSRIMESDRGDGTFIVGDHNIASMEDAYITGIYAANRILNKC